MKTAKNIKTVTKNGYNKTNLNCDDACVENTNSESLLSKLSVIESGYRVDPFLKIFRTDDQGVVKCSLRSAAINRGYLSRLIALESSLEKYLLIYSSIGITHQVISLGAGYDSLYFRLRNQGVINPKYCSYYEVDFPIVPQTKWHFIYKNDMLRSFFKSSKSYYKNECFSIDNGDFNMIGCDMTDTKELETRLQALGIDWNLPTIVFCECSLTYVKVSQSIALTSWLTSKLRQLIFIDYEQIVPHDSFGQIMVRHFRKRNSALKCVEHYPTIHDHQRRFLSLGWKSCSILDIETVFKRNTGMHELKRWQNIAEQFDEQEEFKSKCLHYILLVGCNSDLIKANCLLNDYNLNNRHRITPIAFNSKVTRFIKATEIHSRNCCSNILARWGHCLWHTPSGDIVIFGGYSPKTFRDSTLSALSIERDCFNLKLKKTFPLKETLFSAVAQLANFDVVVFGGRSSLDKASNKLFIMNSYGENLRELRCNKVPEARWKHTLNAISEQRVVLIGGRNKEKYFSDVYVYNVKQNTWKLVKKLQYALYSHSTCNWYNEEDNLDRIVVSGGIDAYGSIHQVVYVIGINEANKVTIIINKYLKRSKWRY